MSRAPEPVVAASPDAADRDAILRPLLAFNDGRAAPADARPLAVLRDPATGGTLGGLWGRSAYHWLCVELLAVPERWRGQGIGTRLLGRAGEVARERGCVGIRLDTFEFQARGFYERNGFAVFGALDDHPRGSKRFFIMKRLPPSADPSSLA